MRGRSGTVLTIMALLAAQLGAAAESGPPPGTSILPAHTAWTSDPLRKCPDLRIADDGAAAVVVFQVSTLGAASRVSIRTSSGSEAFDAAAISCVMKLRFQAATRFGDGVPVESWQSIGWRQVSAPQRLTDVPAPASAAPGAAVAVAATVATTPSMAASGTAAATRGPVGVRVCADASGKLVQDPTLTRPSGDAAIDDAAVKIARSGAGNYHPATKPGSAPLSGCAQLEIRFESQ